MPLAPLAPLARVVSLTAPRGAAIGSQHAPTSGYRVGGSTTLSLTHRPASAVESHLLLSQGQDGVGLEHVVRGGIPQPQMVCPAGGKKVVIARMKRHPRGEESVVLSRLVHLVVVVRVAIFGTS